MACAPGTFVSGCAALEDDVAPVLPWVFSFAPSIPLTRIKNVITITYRVKNGENFCEYDLKVVLLFSSKGMAPLPQ